MAAEQGHKTRKTGITVKVTWECDLASGETVGGGESGKHNGRMW